MPFKTWIGLVVCNLVWSAHPLIGKLLLEEFTPPQVAWIRYASAFSAYGLGVVLVRLFSRAKPKLNSFFLFSARPQDVALVFLLGFLTYCFSPLTQMIGLAGSMATENSVIVAMEPLMSALLAWVVLGEAIGRLEGLALSLALLGFTFLTGIASHNWIVGNMWILASMFGEACFSVLGKKLTLRYQPRAIFGSSLLVGFTFLTAAVVGGGYFHSLLVSSHFTWKVILALLWIGPLGTAGAYLFALMALAQISVMNLVLLLFLQPVVGALLGFFFLGERMTGLQNLGSSLILAGVLMPYVVRLKKWPAH